MPYDCFISYASADLQFAEELHRRLIDQGFTVWFDKARLSAGCDWHHEIEQGCENSRLFLPILTPRWKVSEWTRFETYGAEAVFPLIFQGTWAEVSTPPLERFQAETVTATSLDEANWLKFYATLRRSLSLAIPQKQDRLVHLEYRVNDHFIGRDLDLIRIHEELHCNPRAVLTQGRVRAITAMGGVGKTTLARQYAEKFWRCYPQMFWVDARKGLETEFAALHDILFPDRRNIGLKVSDKAKQGVHELTSPLTRLLIIDNAEDEQTTTAWIPKTGGCHTLITSRFAGWSEAVKTLHLFVLEKGPAIDFLQRRAERTATGTEHADCEILAERLGYLPLALEQAAAYIKKLHRSFTEYLHTYESATRELLEQRALGSTAYPDSAIVSLQPSIEKIGPGALALFRLASMIAATPVEWRMFTAKPDLLLNRVALLTQLATFSPPSNFEFWLLKQIEALVDYSLVDFDGRTLSLHPLLLTVQFETQSTEDRRRNWSDACEILVANAPVATWKIDCRDKWTLENDKKWEQLTPQIDRLLELQQRIPELPFTPAFQLLAVDAYAAHNAYPRAISLCRTVCERLATGTAQSDIWLIEARDSLASLLKQSDSTKEALEEFRSLHTLRVKLQGEDHPAALRALHNAACLMGLLGDASGAETLMRDVLARRKQLFGEDHYDTEISVHDLGWLLNEHTNKTDEAEPLLRHALARWKLTLGIANPDTRDAASNLARLLRNKGDFKEAVKVQRNLMDGTRHVLGRDHLACFEVMHNLALFEHNVGNEDEAYAVISAVVSGYRRYLPPNHRDMLTALQDLGTIIGVLGRLAESEPLLREALVGYESTQEPDSNDTLRTVNNLAGVLDKLGRSEEAKPLHLRHLRAISTKKDTPPIELRGAAHTCLILGEYELAVSFLNRMLAANFEKPGTHCHLARIFLLTGKETEAREEIAQAWNYRASAQPFYVVHRILFFKILFCLLDGTDAGHFLGLFKGAFGRGEAHMAWTIQKVIDHMKPRLTLVNISLLEALAAAIDDKKNIPKLENFQQWLEAPLLTLE